MNSPISKETTAAEFVPSPSGSIRRSRSRKAGLPPGTLVHVGEQKTLQTTVHVIGYDTEKLHERSFGAEQGLDVLSNVTERVWISIIGLHETEFIEKLGAMFKLHPLVLEDIVNTAQRPKVEEMDNGLFFVMKMVTLYGHRQRSVIEQVSVVLLDNVVISFQEREEDVFEPVRQRLRSGRGRIRSYGVDYLAYALLDAVVDHYFVVLEGFDERIERLELESTASTNGRLLREIHRLRHELIFIKKAVFPLREVLGTIDRSSPDVIAESTKPFLRDVYDHTIQAVELIESYRDMLAGLLDLYLSTVSNRMNEIMKVLTIISTIFIPLTFIVGVYGMNFEHMPELRTPWGYPAVWAVMIGLAALMLYGFRKKRWL